MARAARRLEIATEQPATVNEAATRELIARTRPEVVVVCAFGALIKEPLLSEYELLNVHPSLLPRWRGAAPVERAIMAGDDGTGVSIMRLTAGLDSGPVCLAGAAPIGAQDTYGSLAGRLQTLGGELLVRALDELARGTALEFAEQDERRATYAEKIGPEDRLLTGARTRARARAGRQSAASSHRRPARAERGRPARSARGARRRGIRERRSLRRASSPATGERLLYGARDARARAARRSAARRQADGRGVVSSRT